MKNFCELMFECTAYFGITSLEENEESPITKCLGYKPNLQLHCVWQNGPYCNNRSLCNMATQVYVEDELARQNQDKIFNDFVMSSTLKGGK